MQGGAGKKSNTRKGRDGVNFKTAKLKEKLQEKFNETLKAVLPIIAIVMVLCFTIAPIEPGILLAFLLGAVLLIAGMMFFTLGVDMSMTPIGESVGTCMTQTKKLWLMVLLSFILGFIVTISEPDLQVLAEQVPSVPNMVLVLSVAAGVGLFLVASLLRMLFNITLAHMLIVLYIIVFALAFLAPGDFIAVAFDAGGVTTGPMTVPFIMSLGIGISAIRSDEGGGGRQLRPGCAVFCRSDSFRSCAQSDLSSGKCRVQSRQHTGYQRLGGTVEDICRRAPGIYGRDGGISASDHCILCDLSDCFPADAEEDAHQSCGRYGVYLRGSCALSHRRQRGVYACGQLSRAGSCG